MKTPLRERSDQSRYMLVNFFFSELIMWGTSYAIPLRVKSGGQHGKCPPLVDRARTCPEVLNQFCDNFVYRKIV